MIKCIGLAVAQNQNKGLFIAVVDAEDEKDEAEIWATEAAPKLNLRTEVKLPKAVTVIEPTSSDKKSTMMP